MRAIRSKGMKPEMAVRRLVHGLGYRYRLHRHDLPGRPDMVFPSRHKIIFLHGCFWHQHSDPNCKRAHTPRSNTDYWGPKLARNSASDEEHIEKLAKMGWDVMVLWECQVKELDKMSNFVRKFLGQLGPPPSPKLRNGPVAVRRGRQQRHQ